MVALEPAPTTTKLTSEIAAPLGKVSTVATVSKSYVGERIGSHPWRCPQPQRRRPSRVAVDPVQHQCVPGTGFRSEKPAAVRRHRHFFLRTAGRTKPITAASVCEAEQ